MVIHYNLNKLNLLIGLHTMIYIFYGTFGLPFERTVTNKKINYDNYNSYRNWTLLFFSVL